MVYQDMIRSTREGRKRTYQRSISFSGENNGDGYIAPPIPLKLAICVKFERKNSASADPYRKGDLCLCH